MNSYGPLPRIFTHPRNRQISQLFCFAGSANLDVFLLAFVMFVTGMLPFVSTYFVFRWASDEQQRNYTQFAASHLIHPMHAEVAHPFAKFYAIFECRVYFLITMCLVPLYIVEYTLVARLGQRRMRKAYARLLTNILQKKMVFFDKSSAAELYQTLAKDVYIVQEFFPITFIGLVQAVITFIYPVILFIYLDYILAGIFIIFIALCIYMMCWFMKTCRRLLRLRISLKFPVMNHITETANLMTLLRCTNLFDHQTKRFESTVNKHTTARFMVHTLVQAFRLWLTLLMTVATICLVIVYGFQYIRQQEHSFIINIVMYYMIGIMIFVSYGVEDVYNLAYIKMFLKKVNTYDKTNLEDLESGLRYPKIWVKPQRLRFSHIRTATIGHLTMDIRSLKIEPGEHVGFMGRAMSGRRLLVKMLLRLYPFEGTIKVNQRKIEDINICTLRRNIFYISISTALFGPTLRFNLDPRNEFTDSALWHALQLFGVTPELTSLEHAVELNGRNLTVSQKILILLTRAALLKSKIIIIDHIFESIPKDSQEEVEELIFNVFDECTLIFIESRLNYVMRCDRILVIDRGHIMDEDKPTNIYDNATNFLHTIVDKTGYVNRHKLTQVGYYRKNASTQSGSIDFVEVDYSDDEDSSSSAVSHEDEYEEVHNLETD